jgi:hypothetical protein
MRRSTIIGGLIFVFIFAVIIVLIRFDFIEQIKNFFQLFFNLDIDKRTELIFTFISNLFGTTLGALFAFLIALRQLKYQSDLDAKQQQIDTTFDLYQEFATNEMAESRSQVDRIFTYYKEASKINDFYDFLNEAEKKYIRNILYFYRRLQLEIDYKRVDTSAVLDLFGSEFIWWYYVWFEHKVVTAVRWESSTQMQKLHHWIYDQMKNNKKSLNTFNDWKLIADEAKSRRN